MTYVFINALGFSEFMSRILAAAGSVDYLIFAFLAYFVIERYGRRRVMMVSAAACAACWALISIAASQIELEQGNRFQWGCAAIFGFFAFFAAFGMGVLSVPWLYPTEVNALAFRAKGTSLAMASNWYVVLGNLDLNSKSIETDSKQDHELHGGADHSSGDCQSWLPLLGHMGRHLRFFCSHHVLLLSRDCQSIIGGY